MSALDDHDADDDFIDLPVKVKRGGQEYEVSPMQLNTETLRRIFGVSPEGVWLREEISGRVHFPNSNGNFNLRSTFSNNLVVEGPLAVNSPSVTVSSIPGIVTSPVGAPRITPRAVTSASGSQTPSFFRSIIPSSRGKVPGGTLKVLLARMETTRSGRASFTPESQMFIDLTEATATVDYILTAIHRQWGDHITMVSCDGLEFSNSPGSQGKLSLNGCTFCMHPHITICHAHCVTDFKENVLL